MQTIQGSDTLGNIVVSFCKNSSEKKTVVGVHYDNAHDTPGANDNAAACSILLNFIHDLKRKNSEKAAELVFFDMEERSLLGSAAYLKSNIEIIFVVINLDMCGMGSNTVISIASGGEKMLPKL